MQVARHEESEPGADWRLQLESLDAAFGWPGLSTTEVLVFAQLITWLWLDGRSLPGLVIASAVMVAEAIGAANSRTGRRSLDRLVEVGLIEPQEELARGRTLYRVNNPAHLRGPRVIRRDDQRLLPGLEFSMDTGVDKNVQQDPRMDTGVDKNVQVSLDTTERAGEPSGETPFIGTNEKKESFSLQRTNELTGSNGRARDRQQDDPRHVNEVCPELLQARARGIAEYEAATSPVAQRKRIIHDLKVLAPGLDQWFARYVASQVLCGALQPSDLDAIREEMASKDAAAQKGLTRPIDDRARYLRHLLRKLPGWVEPTKREKPR